MGILKERPYPINYVHPNGNRAKIDFIWGEQNNPAPVGLCVWGKEGDEHILLSQENWQWGTFDDAMMRGIRLATKWCERRK